MSRLTAKFDSLRASGRKALVPYIVAGDPDMERTLPLMHKLVAQGSDILEIGVPFSDPMAEGPVIQLAHERALVHAVSLSRILELVAEFRAQDQETPIVLMGYANPVERMGYDQFSERAGKAGVDGVLIVDMPPEEADDLNQALAKHELDNIFLLAPTTTDERIAKVAGLAGGYLYCVSLKGVTGAGNIDIAQVKQLMGRIQAHTNLPVTVGFGIKNAETATQVAACCDGVVVGSALVSAVAEAAVNGGDVLEATTLIRDIRHALDALSG
ncbi:tryptophan synthase subunit alpha [Litorivivens sp.]|uniref:tryptophan synthase subunit alpha n=1 Tax=Litorivivens sp. TaxID=2020868 RepID=UPI0035654191